MIGPGSYDFHDCVKKLKKDPCNAVIKKNELGTCGKGQYVFIGQNIMKDPHMEARFPGCREKQVENKNES